MPTTRVLTPPTVAAEPVSLAKLVTHVKIDADRALVAAYIAGQPMPSNADPAIWDELDLLQLYLSGAREKVEAYTGRYYGAQKLAITYELGEAYELPAGATATAVSGYFTTLAALTAFSLEEYRKGISVNRQLPWGYAMQQAYTVEATTTGDTQYLNLAKRAILEIAAEWYRNRETTVAGVAVISELPVSWRVTLAEARTTVLGE